MYYLPRPVSEADLALMRRIDQLHLEHPFMGARMLRDHVHREGIKVGRKHIGTLMQRMGITALAPQPGTSKRTPGHKIYPYRVKYERVYLKAYDSVSAARADIAGYLVLLCHKNMA